MILLNFSLLKVKLITSLFSFSYDFIEFFTFKSKINTYFILIFSFNFLKLLFTRIYDLNSNVNSQCHRYIEMFGEIKIVF